MEHSQDIFEKEGSIIEARGNQPLLLDNAEKVWIIRSGQIDVFFVQIKSREVTGSRVHLFRAQAGEALFGMDVEKDGKGMALLAVGGPGTSLIEFEKSRLIELSKEFAYAEAVADLINGWVDRLSSGIGKGEVFPRKFQDLKIGAKISAKKSTHFRIPETTVWIKHLHGNSRLMGRQDWPEISKQGFFPLSKHAWSESTGKTELSVVGTQTLLREDPHWSVLEHFHQFVLSCIVVNTKQAEIAEREHLRRKGEADRSRLANAFSRLGTILVIKKVKFIPKAGEEDALLSACQMVGDSLDISVRSPTKPENGGRQEILLEDIARTSGFRIRQVILKEDWWHYDHGPLLAFVQESKRPVALVPASPRKYDIYDTVKGSKKRVTARVAESLAPEAYSFYRPFPERALKGIDLIKFGFRGCADAITMVVFMGILGALLGLLTPIMTGIIFDTIIPEAARGQIVQIAVILITCAVATVMFNVTKGISLVRLEGKMDFSIQAAVWDRLLSLPVPFFRDYSAGDLAQRAMGINQIRMVLSGVTVNAILSCLFSTFNLALLFYYDWQLAFVGVGLSVIGILTTSAASYFMVRYQRKISEIEGRSSGIVLQFISGISKLRVSGTEDRAFAQWARNFADKKRLAFKAGAVQNLLTSFNATFPVVASMSIFTWVIWKSTEGGLSTGSFLAFIAAYSNFQTAMLQMAMALTSSLNIIPLYERARPIIQTLPESDEARTSPGELSGEIEVRHIHFRYAPDGPLILKDVSLQVLPGEFIALVGGSGSGKSTLFRLLLGFETQESGTLYFDGQDLESLDVRGVRRQIGVVLQNAQLMPGDIFKNIIGTSNLTIGDAWEAARMVGVDEDIKAMPMGMHTMVPPGGGTLSGGQRQRLIIARAIVRRPRILFFDEATSALDNRTQAIVSQSLEKLQVTRIVIAHRLSTIINADRIYVLQDGEIIESGTYEALMRQEGFFANLAKRQLA